MMPENKQPRTMKLSGEKAAGTIVAILSLLSIGGVYAATADPLAPSVSPIAVADGKAGSEHLLQGDRKVTGVVRKIAGEQIEVDADEGQPRFLALKEAKEKGFTLNPGDKVEMTINEQNLVVDYHPFHQGQAHKEVKGQIAQSLAVGHEQAVIRTEDGREHSYAIRPLARSKMSSIPVGTNGVFLVDETNQIIDATFDKHSSVRESASGKMSPPKGAHKRVEGTIIEPLQSDKIRIKSPSGEEHPYDVRPIVAQKLAGMKRGQTVILMIDTEGAVIDVAIPPGPKG